MKPKNWLALFMVLLALFFFVLASRYIYSGVKDNSEYARLRENGERTSGTVVNKEDSSSLDIVQYKITYTFTTLNGQLLTKTQDIDVWLYSKLKAGGPATVVYDPANPTSSFLLGRGSQPLWSSILISIICGIAALLIAIVVMKHKGQLPIEGRKRIQTDFSNFKRQDEAEKDQKVIDWLCDEFKQDNGIDLRQDRLALQRLKEAVEKATIELCNVQQTDINLPFISANARGPKHMIITLTRTKLEQLMGTK